MKVKITEIDKSQIFDCFDDDKINENDYVGQIGEAEPISETENTGIFMVKFADGKEGGFLRSEFKIVK